MASPTSVDGQALGQRGIRTRRRILEAIGAAIEQEGLRGIRLSAIADEVGFKPPAFYQYFNDLDDAILALCEEVGDLIPRFELDDPAWGSGHPDGTRPFVEQFFQYWDQHRSLLTARHVAIMSGDRRFQKAADESFRPIAEALQAEIENAQRDGRVDDDIEPVALAAVLNIMIDMAGMSAPSLNRYWGADDSTDLIGAVSFVFDQVLGVDPDRADSGSPTAR